MGRLRDKLPKFEFVVIGFDPVKWGLRVMGIGLLFLLIAAVTNSMTWFLLGLYEFVIGLWLTTKNEEDGH